MSIIDFSFPLLPSSLFFQLVSGKFRPNNHWHKRGFRLKFLLRSLMSPIATFQYLEYLSTLPHIRQALLSQALLPTKIHRPYLCAGFDMRDRLRAVCSHYSLAQVLSNEKLRQLFLGTLTDPLTLFTEKENKTISLYCHPSYYEREGELTLVLNYNAITVATLCFSLINYKNQKTLFIGGLQGASKDTPSMVIREATKVCHGIFPKRLVLEAVFILASQCEVSQIIGVGNSNHVLRRFRYKQSKKKLFHACYDSFWESLGGVEKEKGLFFLPLSPKRKNLDEILSKKRAEYRRRYTLLDTLGEGIRGTLGKPLNSVH